MNIMTNSCEKQQKQFYKAYFLYAIQVFTFAGMNYLYNMCLCGEIQTSQLLSYDNSM